jgi:hypothetical protein
MILFSILGGLTVLVVIYVAWGRTWLKRQRWAVRFFAWIEPIEIAGWRKSETILWARFRQGLGLILTAMASLGQFDLSPVTMLLPPKLQWIVPLLPLAISMSGALSEKLRRDTTKPLELVEVPDAAPLHVVEAVQQAEVAKAVAVATVKTDAAERQASGFPQ